MNAGSFLKYIKSPSLLHQLSYEELKTIVLQYPFSANLHLLLLFKSKLDNHKDYEKNLALAAGHSINRAFLYKLLQKEDLLPVEHKGILKEEDVLELKDLASLEKEPVLLADKPSEMPDENKNFLEWQLPVEPEEIIDDIPDGKASDDKEVPTASMDEDVQASKVPESNELLSTMNALNELIEEVIAHEDKSDSISENEYAEISSLTKTLADLLPASDEGAEKETVEEEAPLLEDEKPEVIVQANEEAIITDEIEKEAIEDALQSPPEEKTKEKKVLPEKLKKQKVSEIASKSIKSQSRVASETLAIILEKQGLTDKAIKMYEQLILTFPEKSLYFAGKIENLKNI
jgi:hypothetical protein